MARDLVTLPVGGRIKGAAFLEFVRWFELEHGHERLGTALRGLGPAFRRELGLDGSDDSLRILSSRWYEAVAIHALLDALLSGADAFERARMAQRGAAAVMHVTLRGMYRLLFDWLASPERYARFSSKLWSAYYDTGDYQVEQATPGRAITRIRNWPAHHPFMCDMHRHVAVELYSAMGCVQVEARREACIDDGGLECRFVATWSERAFGGRS